MKVGIYKSLLNQQTLIISNLFYFVKKKPTDFQSIGYVTSKEQHKKILY